MGLDCLLVAVNQVTVPYPVYPLGMAHIAGVLRAAGHRVRCCDLMSAGISGLSAILAENCFDLIGFSIRNLDTVDSTSPDPFIGFAREAVALVREYSEAPLVLGGPAFSIMPERIMAELGGDYGVVGEGEAAILDIARAVETGTPLAGNIVSRPAVVYPSLSVAYDRGIAGFYLKNGGMLNIQTKRGCPHRCLYCSYPMLEGGSYRFREPQEVADEVARLERDFSAPYIFFTDSVFNDARGRYLEVAEAMIRNGNKVPWCAFFRPTGMGRSEFELLKRSGMAAMEVGTDATSDATLAGLNKDFTIAEVVSFNREAVSAGVPCAHFVIFGGPGEDDATVEEGLVAMEKLSGSVIFAFSGIRVLPDTGIAARAVAEGIMAADRDLLPPFFYFSPAVDRKKMEARIKEAWQGDMSRIFPAVSMQDRITRLHSRGHVGPLWDMLCRTGGWG